MQLTDHWNASAHLRVFTLINRRLTHLCLVTNTVVSVDPHTKKIDIVRNGHGHTQRCKFLVLDWKHPFWANSAQNIKIASLS